MAASDERPDVPVPARGSEEWKAARKRVNERRDFSGHLVAYVVINAFLVFLWVMGGGGYFWPAWVMAGWGIGLVLHAWDVFFRRPVTDADVEAELRRHGPHPA